MSVLDRPVLVIDDEPFILRILSYLLKREGYEVETAKNGQEGLARIRELKPRIVFLDIMMPRMNGYEVCEQVKQDPELADTYIVMLTAKGMQVDRERGLQCGADDYMTKPFSHKELLARVRAVGRRAAASGIREDHGTLESGVLRMDLDRHEVRLGDRPAELTPKEFDLLHCLMLNAGKVVTHENLLNFAWGSNCDGDTEMLKVHIRHLREKIERNPSAPEHVLTIRGVGYKLAVS